MFNKLNQRSEYETKLKEIEVYQLGINLNNIFQKIRESRYIN